MRATERGPLDLFMMLLACGSDRSLQDDNQRTFSSYLEDSRSTEMKDGAKEIHKYLSLPEIDETHAYQDPTFTYIEFSHAQ